MTRAELARSKAKVHAEKIAAQYYNLTHSFKTAQELEKEILKLIKIYFEE